MSFSRNDYESGKQEHCCGTCKYHQHEDITDGWVCVNQGSIYCTEWTEYTNYCTEWEERK